MHIQQTPEQKIAAEYRLKVELCANAVDARGALDLYKQMKAESVTLSPYIFRVIINVCVKAEQSTELKTEAFQVYEDMKADAVFSKGIDESIYSALLKLCSKDHDFERCQALIAEIEEKQMATKLRTFAPLLQAYSEVGDLSNCLAVKSKIEGHEIELTEPEYLALLKVCTATKDAAQFYAVLDEYIDAIAQPDPAAWDVLKDWFSRCASIRYTLSHLLRSRVAHHTCVRLMQ